VNVLAAGLQEARQGFSPLYYVAQELAAIAQEVPSTILLNQQFTKSALADALAASSFPIVHIATHGQFSSNFEDTFIATWDRLLNIHQLERILRSRNPSQKTALELLVLSACETATGDRRAALGLAGMAVRAGTRSTIATLWSVNDQATAELMAQFYGQLIIPQTPKAEALQQAQLALLKSRWYQHPFYWAPYVLVGNWL
jgi:CHAT domain-containing protein